MSLKFIWNRVYWFFVKPPRTLYRFIFRPKGHGVKGIVLFNNSILLVRPTYGHRLWTVPGGVVDRGETYEYATCRELKEETGIVIGKLIPIGEYVSTQDYRTDTIHCFLGIVPTNKIQIDGVEIEEAGWFDFNNLPEDRTPRVDKIIDLYNQHNLLK